MSRYKISPIHPYVGSIDFGKHAHTHTTHMYTHTHTHLELVSKLLSQSPFLFKFLAEVLHLLRAPLCGSLQLVPTDHTLLFKLKLKVIYLPAITRQGSVTEGEGGVVGALAGLTIEKSVGYSQYKVPDTYQIVIIIICMSDRAHLLSSVSSS